MDQFKQYLETLFYQSKYNYRVVKDTNQMSEIDFCVRSTEKTKDDLTEGNIQYLPDENYSHRNRLLVKYEQSLSQLQKDFQEYEKKYNELVRIENKNIQEHRAEVTKFLDTERSIKRRGTLLNLNIKESTIDDTIKKKLISKIKTITTKAHKYIVSTTLNFRL